MDGLILYVSQEGQAPNRDFMAVGLKKQLVLVIINLGITLQHQCFVSAFDLWYKICHFPIHNCL